MAVVALKCPSCNGELEFDGSREFGFCSYCGTKVMIQEEIQKVKVIHSGSVVLDDSGKAGNFLTLADSAMKNGNFGEAYDYYKKVLEIDAKSFKAIFGKGLSAAYTSTPDKIRLNELFNALEDIKDLVGTDADGIAVRFEFQRKSLDCAFATYTGCTAKEYKNPDGAKAHFIAAERVAALSVYALNLLDSAAVASDKKYEDFYKNIIDGALEICEDSLKSVSYRVGFEAVRDKNGNVTSVPVYKKLACPCEKEIKGYIQSLKDIYNNLPSRLAQIAQFDRDIENMHGVIANYESSLSAYFLANPEDEKTYRHPGLFGAKKKRAAIEAKFSSELLAKRDASVRCKKNLGELVKARKKYIAENTK